MLVFSAGLPGAQPASQPILLFDGVCRFCNAFVRFTIRHDPRGYFHFSALQSQTGQALLQRGNLPNDLSTFVYVDGDTYRIKSAAILSVLRQLSGLWPLLSCLIIVPRQIRDWVYDRVAQNRYRLLGQQETCLVPTPDIQQRFLD